MRSLASPVVIVWSVLAAVTLLSWALGAEHLLGFAHALTALLFVVAFVKVWLIGRYFMDLRSAAVPLRLLFDGWVFVVGTALTVMYLVG
jgi:Prokaryotic Cytochrome C oxidase subunit IV